MRTVLILNLRSYDVFEIKFSTGLEAYVIAQFNDFNWNNLCVIDDI